MSKMKQNKAAKLKIELKIFCLSCVIYTNPEAY